MWRDMEKEAQFYFHALRGKIPKQKVFVGIVHFGLRNGILVNFYLKYAKMFTDQRPCRAMLLVDIYEYCKYKVLVNWRFTAISFGKECI